MVRKFDVSPYIVKLQMAIHFRVDLNITTAEYFTVFVNRIIIIRDTEYFVNPFFDTFFQKKYNSR